MSPSLATWSVFPSQGQTGRPALSQPDGHVSVRHATPLLAGSQHLAPTLFARDVHSAKCQHVRYRQLGGISQSPQGHGQLPVRAGGSRSWGKSVLGCLGIVCSGNDQSAESFPPSCPPFYYHLPYCPSISGPSTWGSLVQGVVRGRNMDSALVPTCPPRSCHLG